MPGDNIDDEHNHQFLVLPQNILAYVALEIIVPKCEHITSLPQHPCRLIAVIRLRELIAGNVCIAFFSTI